MSPFSLAEPLVEPLPALAEPWLNPSLPWCTFRSESDYIFYIQKSSQFGSAPPKTHCTHAGRESGELHCERQSNGARLRTYQCASLALYQLALYMFPTTNLLALSRCRNASGLHWTARRKQETWISSSSAVRMRSWSCWSIASEFVV